MALVTFNYFGSNKSHSSVISQEQPKIVAEDVSFGRAKKKHCKPMHLTTKHNLFSRGGIEQQKKWLKLSEKQENKNGNV